MYVISLSARTDLNEIWDYTEKIWGAAQAEIYYRKVVAFDGLDNGTLRGRPVVGQPLSVLKHTVKSHIVFFRVSDNGDIEIIRVLHKRMDVTRHLLDE